MRLRALLPALALAALLVVAPAARADESQRLCTEHLVRMSDGVRLHAWVSRLGPDGPRPVLFMMDSYSRGARPGHPTPPFDNACPQNLPDDYVPAYLSKAITDRFTLVQVAYRGTGSSEGLFDFTGLRTQEDARAAIAWAAALPQSNGRVVLTGESGTAFVAHHVLSEPHVRAAVLFTSCADMYRCIYRGGEYNNLTTVYMQGTIQGYAGGLGARLANGTDSNPVSPLQVAAFGQAVADSLTHSTFDAFWKQRSALPKLAKVRIPVMYTTDLYDIVQPWDAMQLTTNARLNLGMGHIIKDATTTDGARYAKIVRSPVDRFVAHYGLRDRNGAEKDPRVTLMSNLGSFKQFRAGHVLVRGEKSWPLPKTRWTQLYLGAGGTLGPEAPVAQSSSWTLPMLPLPATDTRSDMLLAGGLVPTNLARAEASGMTFTTPVLEQALEVTGPISLRVWASSTAPDFDWSVRLTDVWPGGSSEFISDGYLRASLRKVDDSMSLRSDGRVVRPWLTYDTSEPVPTGVPVEYRLEILPTSNVFAAGHRLRVDILPSANGQLDTPRTLGLGQLTVLHDAAHPSSVLLPVIPARCEHSHTLAAKRDRVSACAPSYSAALRR